MGIELKGPQRLNLFLWPWLPTYGFIFLVARFVAQPWKPGWAPCMRWYEGEESMVPASSAGRQSWGRHSLECKAAGVE